MSFPKYPPFTMPTRKEMRESDRRKGKTNMMECLICKTQFDNLDKKHDDERLSACYCSFKCWGASIDGVYAEAEYRRKHRHD